MSGDPRPDYSWIGLDCCGTCGGTNWRVIDAPHGRVARCEACLPRLREGEAVVERIALPGKGRGTEDDAR
jgi:hypothetical protein